MRSAVEDPHDLEYGKTILDVAALTAALDRDAQVRLRCALMQAGGLEEFAAWLDLLYRLDRPDRDALWSRLRGHIGPQLREARTG